MTVVQSQFAPHVALLVAQECGFLGDVKLEIRQAASSSDQLAGFLDGSLDVAISAIDNLFIWIPSGANVSLFGQAESITPLELFVDPSLKSLQQLEDRPFAVDAFENGFALIARSLFQQLNVAPNFVETGGVGERLQALSSGCVSGTLLGPPFSQVAEQQGFRSLASLRDFMPDYPGQGIIVRNESYVKDEVRQFLHGLERAVDYSNSLLQPEGIQILLNAGLTSSVAEIWDARPKTFRVDPSSLDSVQSLRQSLGLLPSDFNIHEYSEYTKRKVDLA